MEDAVDRRATTCCARCARTATSTRRPIEADDGRAAAVGAERRLSRPSATALPPRDYFTDEIRRQLSGNFGEDEFFCGRPDDPRDRRPRPPGRGRRRRCARGWRSTTATRASGAARARPCRPTCSAPRPPGARRWPPSRCRAMWTAWFPAVVLEVARRAPAIGIEGVAEDEDGHWIPAEDVDLGPQAAGRRQPWPEGAGRRRSGVGRRRGAGPRSDQ